MRKTLSSSLKNTFGLGRGLYLRNIKNIKLFFEGKKARILKNLEREMKEFAKHREFEKANELLRKAGLKDGYVH